MDLDHHGKSHPCKSASIIFRGRSTQQNPTENCALCRMPSFFQTDGQMGMKKWFPLLSVLQWCSFPSFFGAFVNPDEWQHKINETMNTANPIRCQFDFVLFFCSPKNEKANHRDSSNPQVAATSACLETSNSVNEPSWWPCQVAGSQPYCPWFFSNQWVQPKKCTRTPMYLVDKIPNVDTQL